MQLGRLGLRGVMTQVSQYPCKYIYIYETVYYTCFEGRPETMGTAASPSSVPWIGAGGLRLLQALQDDTSHRESLPS
jgi:hypothetical protein